MTTPSSSRYELLRKLAAGGMSEIFLARKRGEGGFSRDVTFKRLFPHLAEYPEVVQRFHMEARLMAALCHPNIPQVFDFGHDGRTYFMVLEHIQGSDLAHIWRAGVRVGRLMPLPVALAIVMQLAEALHHAHERVDPSGQPLRIVHRDVTPHNVMLTRDGVAKLMDFGVALSSAGGLTESDGGLVGTVGYMAPEQIRAQRLDRRADIFSLGVLLYELTTGARLYHGTKTEMLTAAVDRDVEPPSVRVPEYPPGLEAIVMWMLQRERRNRMTSVAYLATAVEQFALEQGMQIGPRVVARYVAEVLPASAIPDPDASLFEAPSSGLASDPAPPSSEAMQLVNSDFVELVDLDSADRHLFDFRTEDRADPVLGALVEEDEFEEQPVVLLDRRKDKEPDSSGDYLRKLGRRLQEQDGEAEDQEPELGRQ